MKLCDQIMNLELSSSEVFTLMNIDDLQTSIFNFEQILS